MKRACVLVIALCLILAGCVKVDVAVELKNDTARIAYSAQVDSTLMDSMDVAGARESVHSVITALEERGFDVDYDTGGNIWTVDAEYKQTGRDAAETARLFEEMVTDPNISPFHIVDFSYNVDQLENAYYFEGLLNTPEVITAENIAFLPEEDAQFFYDAEERGIGTISLALPGTICYLSEGELGEWAGGFTVSEPISLLTPSKLSIAATQSEGGTLNNMADSLHDQFDTLKWVLIGLAVLFCAVTATFIARSTRGRKEQ